MKFPMELPRSEDTSASTSPPPQPTTNTQPVRKTSTEAQRWENPSCPASHESCVECGCDICKSLLQLIENSRQAKQIPPEQPAKPVPVKAPPSSPPRRWSKSSPARAAAVSAERTADTERETSSEKRRRTQERTQEPTPAAVPEGRADVTSRDPRGQSLAIICRMLRGDHGEKLPHGRTPINHAFAPWSTTRRSSRPRSSQRFRASNSDKSTFWSSKS